MSTRRKTSIDREILGEREDLKKARKTRKKEKRNIRFKKFLIFIFVIGTICCYSGLFLLYGPYNKFRDWLITTAMTTMTHQYFATWFYNDDTIKTVLANNKVIESTVPTNTDLINIINYSEMDKEDIKYANKYEKQVLEKDPNHEDYKIIDIKGDDYEGFIAVIYDPSRIQTIVTSKLGSSGEMLVDMAKKNKALVAINGGGFSDPNRNGNGSTPCGITISKGKVLTSASWGGSGGLIGFDEDNKLVLGKFTVTEAKRRGIHDAVTFGPFLIVNGVASKIVGNGGWGQAPRTAIGQREDGIVLFLVTDGRRATMKGATMNDLIEIMQNYGAVNASALDGGTSSAMAINAKIINDPVNGSGEHKTRRIATSFMLMPEK